MVVVADGHDEGMNSVVLSPDDELSEDAGVGAKDAEVSNPPFCGLHLGCVEDETLRLCIKGSSGHETLHIRAVAQLSLRVASQYLSSLCWFEDGFALFVVAEVPEGGEEH